MTCDHPFLCASEVNILGWHLQGEGWFVGLLVLAVILQIAANFVWVINGQVSRHILKLSKDKRGDYYLQSLIWTAVSTIISIVRVVLIGGNNLYIYLTILLGNLIGQYWAESGVKEDNYCISNDLLRMLERVDNSKCSSNVRSDINKCLDRLSIELDKRKSYKMKRFSPYNDYRDKRVTF